MVLLLGRSDLAYAIQQQLKEPLIIVGRPDYDFSSRSDCDRVVRDYRPRVVVNTVAVNENHDPWTVLTTNFVSAAYMTMAFYERMDQGHIINISSAATYWVSYPDIADGRFCYNVSKEALSRFGQHFNRKIVDHDRNVIVSTIELGSFVSKFNRGSGKMMPIERAAAIVCDCIHDPKTSVAVIK